MHNWASLNHRLGKHADAEKLYTKSLILREKYLGHRNIEVASSLTSLAAVKVSLNEHEVARRLYSRALTMLKDIIGEEHQAVAYTATRLGVLLEMQRCFDEAILLFADALEIDEKVYGTQHEQVRKSIDRILRAAVKHANTLRTQKQLLRWKDYIEDLLRRFSIKWPASNLDNRSAFGMETSADLMATSHSISGAIAPEASSPAERNVKREATNSFKGFSTPAKDEFISETESETPVTSDNGRGAFALSRSQAHPIQRGVFSTDPPIQDIAALRRHPSETSKAPSELMGTSQTSEFNFSTTAQQEMTRTISHAYPLVHDNSQFGMGAGTSAALETGNYQNSSPELPYNIPAS